MGNKKSSLQSYQDYKDAIDTANFFCNIPTGKRTLPVIARESEPHPAWYLYELRLSNLPENTSLALEKDEEYVADVSVKSRKVKFDDVLNPYPHVSERHPFFLDYGEGIQRRVNDDTIYSLSPEEIPARARQVKFEDILDLAYWPQLSDYHPVILDFRKGVERKHNDATVYQTPAESILPKLRTVKFDDILDPEPRYLELHHHFLDYGEPVQRHHSALYTPVEFSHPDLIPVKARRVKFDDILDPDPRYSELHPLLLDYGEGIARSHNDPVIYFTPPDAIPIKPRMVKFDDILNPDPRGSELHPLLLDQGEGLQRRKIPYHFEVPPEPKWPTPVQFGLDYAPRVSEIHPFKLHYGHNLRVKLKVPAVLPPRPYSDIEHPRKAQPVHINPLQNKESIHSVSTHIRLSAFQHVYPTQQPQARPSQAQRQTGVSCVQPHPVQKFTQVQEQFGSILPLHLYRVSIIKFAASDTRMAEEGDILFEPPVGKKVHFSILHVPRTRTTKRVTHIKPILKQYDQSEICITVSEKILHESIVLACHLHWSLQKAELPEMSAASYLSTTAHKREKNPMKYAPNRKFLASGCPTLSRLNKVPQIDFTAVSPRRMVKPQAATVEESDDDMITTSQGTPDEMITYDEAELQVQESMYIDIETHAHLKQSHFPHLRSTTLHKKSSPSEHKVLLEMQATNLDAQDIEDYLWEVCHIGDVYQGYAPITDVSCSGGMTSCKIAFPSGKTARKFKTHMDRIKHVTYCHAKIHENFQDSDVIQRSLRKRMDLVYEDSLNSLSSHQAKKEEISAKLKKSQTEKCKPSELHSILEEQQALRQKWQELKNQEEEYLTFIKTFQHQFLNIPPKAHWEDEMTVMVMRYEIEKERLQAALPMYAKRTEIVQMIAENQVSILLGETGSGKSTQVTQYLFEAGLAKQKKIVCTQPRKVAATSLAKRVSAEMHSQVGDIVGYKVGMQKHVSRETKIVYVTDHMLLKECQQDPLLTKYSCVIIDEAHERSLNTDLLLGMIKRALVLRPELRVIITSATINPDVFVAFFNGCPVLKVSGRVFPVEVKYEDDPVDADSNFVLRAVKKALEVALKPEPGDILIFLTTPLETEQACEKMMKMWPNDKRNIMCLALHGKTQSSDQQRVFNPTPDRKRKIVFATNSAETSVTIPGIKVVIDTGLAKEKLYDHKKNMSSLKVNKISQSSANQRKGRAGRTERGKCYRLYTEEDYDTMDTCSKPEIMKVHLGMALLTLLSFDIEDPLSFDFVEMPPKEGLHKAMDVLVYLEAVDKDGNLTPLGKKLATMSLEPRMAKLVLNGIERNIGFESVLIASFSTMGGNMFFRGGSERQKQKADKLKVRFCNLRGDIHTMLDVYKEWNCQSEKDKNAWCRDNSINAKSMRMVRESVSEIQSTLSSDLGIKLHHKFHADKNYMESAVETVIVESFAMNLCVFAGHESLGYMAVTELDKLVHVHPSSALKSLAKSPRYMVYENTLTTSRAFVINITCISDSTFEAFCEKGNPVIDVDEVNSRITSPCVISDVGTSIVKKICGVKHSTRVALEKELQVFFHTEMLTLETKVEQGTVSVYTVPGVKDECYKLVQRMVVQEQEGLYQEEMERPLVEGCPTRVIIEHGGQTKRLLFADEFRTLHIPSVPPQYSAEELVEQFREVAVVTDYESYYNNAQGRRGLKITFEDPDLAEEVLTLLQETGSSELFPGVVAKPDRTGAKGLAAPHVQNVSLKITWCRRPNKGIAFVKFPWHSPNAARDVLEYISHINIGGQLCPVKTSRKSKEELFVRNIPRALTFRDVSKAIREFIEEETVYRPTDIVVPTEKPMETSQTECTQYKKCIETHIQLQAPGVSDVEINLKKPESKANQFIAFIYLKNGPDAARIQGALTDMTIMGQATTVEVTMKSSIIVRKELFRYIQDELETRIEELENEIDGVHCRGEWMRRGPGGYRLEISARSALDLTMVRTQLSKCVDGQRLEVKAQHLQYFKYNRNGQTFIQRVQQKCHVLITIDQYQSMVILHGGEHALQQATEQIEKKVELLEQSHTKEFDLKEQFPPGMTKRLMGQYGLDLQDLAFASGADFVNLQLRQHLLTVHGKPEAMDNVQKLLDAQAFALTEEMKSKEEQNLPDCPVCFCEVDSKELYRLEYCGHAYCMSCVKSLLEHGARDKSFPIQCAQDGCNKDIVMKDIFALVGTSMDRLKPFITASVDSYVMTHGNELKYCITPECNMIYPVHRHEVEVCTMCQIKICTGCHSEYHPPLSCKLNKEVKENLKGRTYDDYCKETWLEGDTKNRALCPQCKLGIEKNGGCLHVHCIQCKTHICWVCKATFKTSGETYAHIRECNGSIFDDDDLYA